MDSPNGSGRPSGCVSIPVEIIRGSNSTGGSGSQSRHNSPFRTPHNDIPYGGGFTDSPPWAPNSTGRFQPRHSPGPSYDRVITNSHYNQPQNDHLSYQPNQEPQYRHSHQQMYEPGPLHFSRSNDDLLSSPFDSMRYSTQQPFTSLIPPSYGSGFRTDSDFVHPTKYTSPLRRSYDALNDFGDMQQSFPTTRPYPSEQQRKQEQQQQQQQQPFYRSTYQTQYQPQSQKQQQQQQQQQPPTYANQSYTNPNIVYINEYGVPTDHYQPNTSQGVGSNVSNDRSRSPTSQRGASPARPPPTTTQQQQQQQQQPPQEPELKMAKDTDGPIPMPAPTSSSSSPSTQSADQQVPSTDTSTAANIPSPPSESARNLNTIALEKLEQIKQSLDILEKEVDIFAGSTRNERAYKLLDEQAVEIMIRCDELVDVGADIKEKRKEIIRNVQKVIGKLESKVPATPAVGRNSNPLETAISSPNEPSTNNNEEDGKRKSTSPPKENASASITATEQSIST